MTPTGSAACTPPMASAECDPTPRPAGNVEGTDGGDNDRLALLAVNDIQDFWTSHLPAILSGPIHADLDRSGPTTRRTRSAAARAARARLQVGPTRRTAVSTTRSRGIAALLIPNARKYFGDIAVAGMLAHEFGHAVQTRAHTRAPVDPHASSKSNRPTASPGSICTGWPRATPLVSR